MARAFYYVPLEIFQAIAHQIAADKDLNSFSLVSTQTYAAIHGDGGSFWRKRFLKAFDAPSRSPTDHRLIVNDWYKKQYRLRQQILRQGCRFTKSGQDATEFRVLRILRDLVVDSYPDTSLSKVKVVEAKNMRHIGNLIASSNLLRSVFRPKREIIGPNNHLYYALIVILTHAALLEGDCFRFPVSQQMVYAPCGAKPLFLGDTSLQIDMEWLAHSANFWRFHLARRSECTLYGPFMDLAKHEKPKAWSSKLTNGSIRLGREWKGSYAFIEEHEMGLVSTRDNETYHVLDQLNQDADSNGFQDLTLDYVGPGEKSTWCPAFDVLLKPLPPYRRRAKTRAQAHNTDESDYTSSSEAFYLQGSGKDNHLRFFASGRVEALPTQQGIPGWQRVTMMKYWADSNGVPDMRELWCYEGIALPGGQIIIGRWWRPEDDNVPDDEQYCGPFILWNCDAP